MPNEKKYTLQKVFCGALATVGLAACFTSCGNKKDSSQGTTTEITQTSELTTDSITEEQTQITEPESMTELENEEYVSFKRKDGSILMLLTIRYKNAGECTVHTGYITYDKNGVYFDDVLENRRFNLDDESSFDNGTTEFYYVNFTSLCSENELLSGKVGTNKINQTLDNVVGVIAGYRQLKMKEKDSDETYTISIKLFEPANLFSDKASSSYFDENAVYTLGQDKPIYITTTTYVDESSVTIENTNEQEPTSIK